MMSEHMMSSWRVTSAFEVELAWGGGMLGGVWGVTC